MQLRFKKSGFLFLFLVLVPLLTLHAQKRSKIFLDYIEEYKGVAIEEMRKYKIPASITLAQGLLESGAGRSALARESNNHFGIKCGSGWTGKKAYRKDDGPNDCFRVYTNAKESFRDHSIFLSSGARYSSLFKLRITDYKGWARELKKAGYATDPSYANRLISIIEDYELYKYDSSSQSKSPTKEKELIYPHQVYIANDIAYIVARDGDTFDNLAKELGVKKKKLIKYNDLDEGYTLTNGDIIYLKQKNKKAGKSYKVHIVRDGDSMHSISQTYGIRLKNLYKMNRKDSEYIPEIGDRLKLR